MHSVSVNYVKLEVLSNDADPIASGRASNQFLDISKVINVDERGANASADISHSSLRDRLRCKIVVDSEAVDGSISTMMPTILHPLPV